MNTGDLSAVDNEGRTYRILTSADELMSIRSQWDRLWGEAGAEYFLSFSSVCESWNRIYRPQGAALRCAVVCDHHRLLGVLPMILRRPRLWKIAGTCGPRSAEGCDMLIERSTESHAIASALLTKFLLLARPDYVDFEFVQVGCALESAIQSIPRVHIIETWDNNIPYATLQAERDWTSYTRSLSKSYQADCARCSRRLNEQGRVTFEVVRGMYTPLIDWLFEHKRKWSERTNKRGEWVFSRYYQEFLNTVFSSDPRFLVFALRLDEIPIAVKLMAINTNSASLIIIAFDEKYKRFSPGNVLDESMMRYVFENYRSADGSHLDITFGPGMERFKLHWSRGYVHPARSYRIVTSGRAWAKTRLKQAIAKVLTSNARALTRWERHT
ncbi:MAG: family N-acetyltransferase [Gammaproteobacteria bacterium]|nr:family N-acetyltransferase [Gammaproteobacteria bacterium]